MEIDIVTEINKAVSEMTGIVVQYEGGEVIEWQVQSAALNDDGLIVLTLA